MTDTTPDGEAIDTQTIWLAFEDEEVGLSLDLTRWNAEMAKLKRASQRGKGEEL